MNFLYVCLSSLSCTWRNFIRCLGTISDVFLSTVLADGLRLALLRMHRGQPFGLLFGKVDALTHVFDHTKPRTWRVDGA